MEDKKFSMDNFEGEEVRLDPPKHKEKKKAVPKPKKKTKHKIKVLFGFITVNGVSVNKGECVVIPAKDWDDYKELVAKGIIEEV